MSTTFEIPEGIVGNFFLLDKKWPNTDLNAEVKKPCHRHFFVHSIEDGGTDYELGSGGSFSVYYRIRLYKFEIGTEKVIEVTRFHTKETLLELTKHPLTIENLEKIKNEYK